MRSEGSQEGREQSESLFSAAGPASASPRVCFLWLLFVPSSSLSPPSLSLRYLFTPGLGSLLFRLPPPIAKPRGRTPPACSRPPLFRGSERPQPHPPQLTSATTSWTPCDSILPLSYPLTQTQPSMDCLRGF
jgi:hypothetical protein